MARELTGRATAVFGGTQFDNDEPDVTLLAELRADAASAKLFAAVFVGLAMGVVLVIGAVAISALIFSGTMAPLAVRGAGLVLFGTFVLCLAIALTGGYRGAVSAPQDAPVAVVVSVAAAAGASMVGAAGETLFMTLVVILILTTTAAGACIALVGRVRTAGVLRFVPYPVVGGYLAGAGWILALAAFAIMSGVVPDWESLPRFVEPPLLWKWLPGVAYVAALRLALARWSHFLVMPVSFVLAAGLYHLGLALLDISDAEAAAAGLLFPNIAEHRLWPAFHPGDFVHVDWSVVIAQAPNILIVVPVVLISLLMDLRGIQAASGVELDLDREFRAAGLANMIATLGGGSPPGYHTVSCSLPSRMFGAYSRLTGIAAAAFVAAVLFGGGGVLQWFPVSLMGGLTLFIGFDLLKNFLFGSRLRRFSADYAVVLLVFLTVAVFGFVEGVVAGLAIAAILLAVRLARIDPVEAAYTLRERHSTVKRPMSHRAILLERGNGVRVYRLRGYIFFGSAHTLVDRLREPLREDPPPLCILLDCTDVAGFDTSALDALGGFAAAASSLGVRIVAVAPAERQRTDLQRSISDRLPGAGLLVEREIDRALELCEDMAIAEGSRSCGAGWEGLRTRMIADTMRYLDRQVMFEELVERLDPWLESRTYAAGQTVAAAGGEQDGMGLVAEGRLSVFDEDGKRLRQHGPGDVLSVQAAFGDYRAPSDAVAEDRCRIMLLTPVARRVLENDDPRLALEFDRYVMSSRIRPPDPMASVA